jgi:tRNA (cmo5U34)-methyltransferase
MILNGFDRIAFTYDFLAKLIYGNHIVDSQEHFLDKIRDHSKILMLGGGSGWLLAALLKKKPNCEVWYIEASGKMIALSKNKVDEKHNIHFIHGTEQNIPSSLKYDAVITNFYLDLFADEQLGEVIGKIRASMKVESFWIATDFNDDNKWWQKVLLKTMYFFFRITCGLESQELPEWNKGIKMADVREVESKSFYRGFIKTALYQR